MMSLGIRKIIVLLLIGLIFLAGNILLASNWLAGKGIEEKASWIRQEFLTGTAITVIVALLILLVSPKGRGRAVGLFRRCPVCDHRLISRGSYCSECGSKV